MNTGNINQGMSRHIFQILSKSPQETLSSKEIMYSQGGASSPETLASLEALSAGDILKGRIQSFDNGLLLIKLLDGAVFTAKAPEGFTAEPGEMITLMIGERLNDQITAKITDLQTNRPNEGNTLLNDIRNALDALGIVDPERMALRVLDLVMSRPEMPLDKAAFLIANNLSDDPGLEEIIHKISEHEFSLHENLKTIENSILNSLSRMDARESAILLRPLIVKQTIEEIMASLKNTFPEAPSRLMESISEKINEILMKTFMEEISGQESVDVANAITKEFFETVIIAENMLHTTNDLPHGHYAEGTDTAAESLLQTAGGRPNSLDSDEKFILEAINKALEDYHAKTAGLQKDGEEALKTIKEVIEKLFDKASIKADNGVTEEFDIKEKSQALKDIMELAQKVARKMDSGDRESIMSAFKETDNAFRFFAQVTAYDSILQLPLRINGEETTGELYIMKRKKGRKKIDTENFTLFISLKTERLGLIESYLNAARKRITISFRVENENLVRLIKDNYNALYDGLFRKGFILVEMKCRVLDRERINPFNAGARAKELFGTESRVDVRI